LLLQADRIFFVDGQGGAGKTFLYNVILAKVRSGGKVALALASSGIAALLLDDGTTAHSRLGLPIPIDADSFLRHVLFMPLKTYCMSAFMYSDFNNCVYVHV
jgi:hypothetical protein